MENLTLEELCVHQVCIWKKSSFRESLECMARNGVFKTAVWKPLLDETELKSAKQNLIDSGVKAIRCVLWFCWMRMPIPIRMDD